VRETRATTTNSGNVATVVKQTKDSVFEKMMKRKE
jgi:hypothetical protein